VATHHRWKSFTLTWFGKEVEGRYKTMIINRLHKAGSYFVDKCRENISESNAGGRSPSAPGEFPHYGSGDLAKSVKYDVDETNFTLKVGTDEPYGYYLELGTSGGKVLIAAPGRVFTWIDKDTGERVFSKRVTLGAIKPRSFLRRTMYEEASKLTRILTSGAAGGRVRAGGKSGDDKQVGGGRGGYVPVGDRE